MKLRQMQGSGKTSLLNAILQRHLLPSEDSGRAVTSSVTEVRNDSTVLSRGRVAWLHQKAVQGTLDISKRFWHTWQTRKNLDDLSELV